MRSIISLAFLLSMSLSTASCFAGSVYDPKDPRPDLLPHPVYNHWTSYRATYNRPRYFGGMYSAFFEPTSQEAYAWQESRCQGYYGSGRATPIKMFCYPKPWEALDTGPRRDPSLVKKYQKKED